MIYNQFIVPIALIGRLLILNWNIFESVILIVTSIKYLTLPLRNELSSITNHVTWASHVKIKTTYLTTVDNIFPYKQ